MQTKAPETLATVECVAILGRTGPCRLERAISRQLLPQQSSSDSIYTRSPSPWPSCHPMPRAGAGRHAPYDLKKRCRYLERLGPAETLSTCYTASGAGYVLQRELATWGIACTVIAPSLLPPKPGVQRKHEKYDASQLARLFRAGELTAVHIPTEPEERGRDLVQCSSTFQREILNSRHYVLKFQARHGPVYRDGTPLRQPHHERLPRLARADSSLAAEPALK